MDGKAARTASWRIYAGLLGSPLLVVALVAALAIVAVNVLGAVRAYVAGESMWSKARAEAVEHLYRYAKSHDDQDMVRFHAALQVPENDRLAREAMERGDTDRVRIQQWLILGRNHPDDVASMVSLFHWFGDQWVLRDAREIWAEADTLIARLNEQANTLQSDIHQQAPPEQIAAVVQRINELNTELNLAGVQFSKVLGQAARITEVLLVSGLASVAVLLSLISVVQVRRVLLKQARHQDCLNQIHRRWELASKAAGFGLYEMDKATGNIRLDDKAAALHGLGYEALVIPRVELRNVIIAEDGPRTRQETDQALQAGDDYKIVYRVRHPDGSVHALEATGRLLQSEEGQPPRLMGVLRDVTEELSQAETAVKRDAAERVAASQREFLSRLSHELRTPLNAILGFAQLMQMEAVHSPPTHARQVNMILDAGHQLLALVEDVLDLSKVESGHVDMNLQRVDVVPAIRACTALLNSHLEPQKLTLMEQLPDAPLWVMADPQRLHQVLINLLTNACKYNRPQGQVTVRAQASPGDLHGIVIHITDTGMGLTPAEQAELFQPFKRVNPSAHIEGTGLGLYIVKQLVDRMGGQVAVRSEPGKGSQFSVTLPAAAPIELQPVATPEPESESLV
ncbi:MAG: PAS domain-containing sensor histidine kinase [Burkholderiales bacterium]|nr:PAS domain-containing sensor histidine kinase [Burkholderiales bacterium]